MDYAEKMRDMRMDYREYADALEVERRKILVFQRELPLCLELVTQAIESCRQQLSGTTTEYNLNGGQSEFSEETSSEGPVLEEFIPIKRDDHSSDFLDEDPQSNDHLIKDNDNIDKKKMGQADWLRSAQLWNQTPDSPVTQDLSKNASIVDANGNGGAFQPFQREKSAVVKTNQSLVKTPPSSASPPATSSTAETASGVSGESSRREEERESQAQRKQRRCWSPELHKRFLHALQQLGGSHAATPKQIRELMKVDGLTNDEVKSHLQKYRLHTRRPNSAIQNNGNGQAPQFVVVGGIWVPAVPEYAAVATASTTGSGKASNGIYAPVAAPPPSISQASTTVIKRPLPKKHHSQEIRGVSDSEGGVHSNSPATSTSTHTTIASPSL